MTTDDPVSRAASDVTALYARHADLWDRVRGPHLRLEAGWMARFAASLPPGGQVLDLGCGTGRPLGAWLLSQGFGVTGVDAALPALERARNRLPAGEWICADIRGLALGRTFDGLLAWDSLFHLTAGDQSALFPILAAHAAPGAALMFTSGPEAGVAMGDFGGDPLHHASLDPETYRRLLDVAGFDVVDFTPEDPDCGGHSVWLALRRLG